MISKIYNNYIKILIDLFLALILLIFLSPIFVVVIILLKFSGEGEIFFFQKRIGYKMKNIKIFKFATMLKNSPEIGDKLYTAENDKRILKIGKFLRQTKLNELPQIINILVGNMSIVGPRPLVEETFNFYSETGKQKITYVKPGITGLSSIFFSKEDKLLKNVLDKKDFYKKEIAPIKEKLEIFYVDNISLFLDIKIIVCTFLKLIGFSNFILIKFFPRVETIIRDAKLIWISN